MNSDTQTVRRPWPISLTILGIWIVIVLGGELLQVRGQPTGLDELATNQIIIGVVVAVLFLIGTLSYLHWWPLVGWKRPEQWRDLRLLWLPALALLSLISYSSVWAYWLAAPNSSSADVCAGSKQLDRVWALRSERVP